MEWLKIESTEAYSAEDLLSKVTGPCEQADFDEFIQALSATACLGPPGSARVFCTPSQDMQAALDDRAVPRGVLAVDWSDREIEVRYPTNCQQYLHLQDSVVVL